MLLYELLTGTTPLERKRIKEAALQEVLRLIKEEDPQKLIFATNLEAAAEIARQIRLRDLAGLLVLDFIDMEDVKNTEKVISELKFQLSNDRAEADYSKMSRFGLLEMTRERTRPGMMYSMQDTCPTCKGSGRVRSRSEIAMKIERAIVSKLPKLRGRKLRIVAAPALHAQIAALGARYRVIAPDLRGFGQSDFTPGTVTMAYMADDVAGLLEKLLDMALPALEKKKFAATERPRAPRAQPAANPRTIPAQVKREVWRRDARRCTFMSATGRRCACTRGLEYDHVQPVALGGGSTAENVRILCRKHNQLEAERKFGAAFMKHKRDGARRGRAQADRTAMATPDGRPGSAACPLARRLSRRLWTRRLPSPAAAISRAPTRKS